MPNAGGLDDDLRGASDPRLQRCVAWLGRHPLLIVGVVAGAVGVGHAVWIWTHRTLGGFDPDESGYIATALRYQRVINLSNPFAFIHEVGATGTGPMVPLLALPLLVIGPRDPRTVMLLQPILMSLAAVSVAGITRRLVGPWTAVAAGVSLLGLSTFITATQSFWYGLGAATAMAGAMWALVTSDRCTNRRVWWFGLLTACMLLSRTMALGFLPAVVVAGLIVAGRDRARLRRLAAAFGVTLAVAGPWWVVEASTVFTYLTDYGYGDRADLFGGGTTWERIGVRARLLGGAVGWAPLSAALEVAVVGAVVIAIRGRRSVRARPGLTVRDRFGLTPEVSAVAAAFFLGMAALVSTGNNGVWFDLPMIMLVVPLLAWMVSWAPAWLRPLPVFPAIGMGVVNLLVSWWLIDPGTVGVRWLAESTLNATHYEAGFAQYDPRFATARRGDDHAAARAWWAVTTEVQDTLQEMTRGQARPMVVLSGNTQLFNTNTLLLESELDPWNVAFDIPDTTDPADRLRALWADPELPRDKSPLVVLARHGHIVFTPDRDVADFAEQADELGYEVRHRVPLPQGGAVEILERSP